MENSSTPRQKAKRYTAEEKAAILDFIAQHKTQNSRGAQKAASEKFGVSAVTISTWNKALKKRRGRKPGSKNVVSSKKDIHLGNPEELRQLASILEQISELEALVSKLDDLHATAEEIKAKILG
ncbi:MAG: hypothetical protein RR889_04715 [Akkermansia sp.]